MSIIGIVSKKLIKTLNLDNTLEIIDRNIYIGDSNLKHMETSHPDDYKKYGGKIKNILSAPDYVGMNPKDNSIEYVKEFLMNGEYVKVAVRVSSGNKFYARSMYVLNKNRVVNFIKKGTLKKY